MIIFLLACVSWIFFSVHLLVKTVWNYPARPSPLAGNRRVCPFPAHWILILVAGMALTVDENQALSCKTYHYCLPQQWMLPFIQFYGDPHSADSWHQWFSKYGPQKSNISFIWALLEMQIPTIDQLNQKYWLWAQQSCCNKPLRWLWCPLNFETSGQHEG